MNYRKKAILVVGALLCLNLSMYSQDISLKMSNVSVKKAITELQTQSGYSLFILQEILILIGKYQLMPVNWMKQSNRY